MPVQVQEKSCIATEKSLVNQCVMELLLFNRSLCFVTFIFLLALDTAIKLRLTNNILRLPSFSLAIAFVGVIVIYCSPCVVTVFFCVSVALQFADMCSMCLFWGRIPYYYLLF